MRKAIIIVALFLIPAGLWLVGYLARDTDVGPLPTDPSMVTAIEAYLETRLGNIEQFTIDPADHARVLRLFEGGTPDPNPLPWVVAGRVEITHSGGKKSAALLFLTFKGPGAYRVGRRYYRGSSDEAILGTIIDCYRRRPEVGAVAGSWVFSGVRSSRRPQ